MNREQVLEIIKQLTEECEKTTDLKIVAGILYCLRGVIFYRNGSLTSYNLPTLC
jgi:hypothetical protein